jgi:uncharacterized protein (DUF58 family)
VTRNGYAVIALAMTSFGIARVFGLLELYVIGAGLVALIVAATAYVLAQPIDLDVRRESRPTRPEVGDEARMKLVITPRRRHAVIELWEPVGENTGAAMSLAPSGSAVTVGYALPTSRRGVVRVGPMSASTRDPFGIIERHAWIADGQDLVVRPRTVPLAMPAAGRGRIGRWLAERSSAIVAAGDFRTVREYVPGDDLRRVHWSATARRGELIVREFDADVEVETIVVLDVDASSYDGDDFELAVSTVASLVADADHRLTAVTSDGEILATDDARRQETLDRLATIDTVVGAARWSPPRSTASSVVHVRVTGRHGAGAAPRPNGHHLTVVVACGASRSEGRFAIAPRSLADLHDLWSELAGPGT